VLVETLELQAPFAYRAENGRDRVRPFIVAPMDQGHGVAGIGRVGVVDDRFVRCRAPGIIDAIALPGLCQTEGEGVRICHVEPAAGSEQRADDASQRAMSGNQLIAPQVT
jgi:hypothetical protein